MTELVTIPLSRLPHVPIPETAETYSLWIEEDERVVVFLCDEIKEAA